MQTAEKNDWIEDNSWLNKTDVTFTVQFGKQKVTTGSSYAGPCPAPSAL